MEKIYTIPVNEAFEEAVDSECGCPFCLMYKKLQTVETDAVLSSMMEPNVRIKTNELGFCGKHYALMKKRNRMLGVALMLESHLGEISALLDRPVPPEGKKASGKSLEALECSCYICMRIDKKFSDMLETAVYLYEKDGDFKKKFEDVRYFCLPHYRRLAALAGKRMPKKLYADFYSRAHEKERKYTKTLTGDVSWFAKKFDYRYDKEPWYNARGSTDRAVKFLCGDLEE